MINMGQRCTLFIIKRFLALLLYFVLFSCNTKVPEELYIIDPSTFDENKILLSEIADDIEYIPLSDSIPIGLIRRSKITDKFIYIQIRDYGILQFDRSGGFIQQIGSVGRGPGEYRRGSCFDTDEKMGNIYISADDKVLVYSSSGIFLREFKKEGYSDYSRADGPIVFNSYLFFPDYNISGNSKYNWVILDILGNFVTAKENTIPPFVGNVTRSGNCYIFDNKLLYFNYFNDTIFSISPDLNSTGAYVFAKGDFRWPSSSIDQSILVSIPKTQEWLYSIFQIDKMFETKRFIVIDCGLRDKAAITFIDKKTKETFLAMEFQEIMDNRVYYKPSLINDLDGGIPLKDIDYYFDNNIEYIVEIIDAFELKTYLSSDLFKDAEVKYPEKKQELQEMADRLDVSDNPVLMLVKLK